MKISYDEAVSLMVEASVTANNLGQKAYVYDDNGEYGVGLTVPIGARVLEVVHPYEEITGTIQ